MRKQRSAGLWRTRANVTAVLPNLPNRLIRGSAYSYSYRPPLIDVYSVLDPLVEQLYGDDTELFIHGYRPSPYSTASHLVITRAFCANYAKPTDA